MKEKTFEKELPKGYRLEKSIDATSVSFGLIFTLASLIILVIALALCALPVIFRINEFSDGLKSGISLSISLAFLVGYFAYIILHELTHGFAYKKLTGEKLTFGISWSCAFCGVPHIFTYRKTALIAVTAPLILFTALFIPALVITLFVSPMLYIILALLFSCHISGCSGDIYVTLLFLCKYKDKNVLMNDTGPKMAIFTYNEEWINTEDSATSKFIQKLNFENEVKSSKKGKTNQNTVNSTVNDKKAEICQTAKKWYELLEFPERFDKEFELALENTEILDLTTVENYDKSCTDGKANLISFLYFCEAIEKRYEEIGIPKNILIDTLKDVVVWCETWSLVKGELYLGELGWLTRHLKMRLFKLGRLQFCMGKSDRDIPEFNIKNGDNVLEVHIPTGDRLDACECEKSFAAAKEFFAKYFPDFKYTVFTCHSWLLDPTLKKYLSENSNIIKFGDMWTRTANDDSNALIRYIFRWDANEENLSDITPPSSFAKKIKDAILGGETFHETLGVIKA